jgi:hypothetical protein
MFLQLVVENQAPELWSWSKVEEQPYLETSGSQIVQDLRLMRGVYVRTGLGLHEDTPVNNQVRAEFANYVTSKSDCQRNLTLSQQAGFGECEVQRFDID